MSSAASPIITIGLPVRNGGTLFEDAVRSLLAQSEERLVLLISDNASTDGTAAAAERFAAQDPRVAVLHQEEDIGPVANFNLVREAAETPYFVWAAHDDSWHPEFLETAVGLLDAHPDAVAATCGVEVIEGSTPVRRYRPGTELESDDPAQRIAALRGPWWFNFWAVQRLGGSAKSRAYRGVWNGDGAFVFEQLLHGPMAVSSRVLRRYRILDIEEKAGGPQRDIRISDPRGFERELRRLLRAAALSDAQRRRIAVSVTRLYVQAERSTRADDARRRAASRMRARRWGAALAPALVAGALYPLRTLDSVLAKLRRRSVGS